MTNNANAGNAANAKGKSNVNLRGESLTSNQSIPVVVKVEKVSLCECVKGKDDEISVED